MKNKTLLAAIAALLLGVASGAAIAQDDDDDDDRMGMYGPGMMGPGMMHDDDMMRGPGMMHRWGRGYGPGMMHGRGWRRHMMGPGMMGMGMMHGRGMGCGMMRGMGPRHCMRLMEMADANNDGRVSAEEASSFWAGEFKTYDANGDGSLSLEEFAAMHAAHARPMMVDRFQFFDDDGDAKVSEDELQKPFERMRRFMGRWDGAARRPRGVRGRTDDDDPEAE